MKSWIFLFLLVVYLHGTSARKHSLNFLLTETSGIQELPQFVGVAILDDVQVGSCNSNNRTAGPKQDLAREFLHENKHHLQLYSAECFGYHDFFRHCLKNLKQRLNQTGDIHILQMIAGCGWDDETGEVTGINVFGYDGEDFISLDLKNLTWIALEPEAVITTHEWNTDRFRLVLDKNFHDNICPDLLRRYVDYGRSFLLGEVLPSVSLLQKTSSSPVRCLATGFYPKTASLVWRRDGVEIHEDVEHGEILPNQDGTFQMSVDLDVSSVRAEDWGRWDCVFQFSGVKKDMVTILDRAGIRTNEENPRHTGIIVGAAVVVFAVITVTFIFIFKKKKGRWIGFALEH